MFADTILLTLALLKFRRWGIRRSSLLEVYQKNLSEAGVSRATRRARYSIDRSLQLTDEDQVHTCSEVSQRCVNRYCDA